MLRDVADVGLNVAEKRDVIIPGNWSLTLSPVGVDVHLNLPDPSLTNWASPYKRREEGFILRDSISLE